MLPGLDSLELGRLRMSVGYGTHKKGRPLSPIEVGCFLRRARFEGASLQDCATMLGLKGTGHVGRFLRILELPHDIQHMVDWGADKDTIGFSAAVELVRLDDPDDQRTVAQSVLADRLTSKEVRQVGQLRTRTNKTIVDCIAEVLGMRPTIDRRYVYIGTVVNQITVDKLGELSQRERDRVLQIGIDQLHIQGASGRLGSRFFTLVGGECFNDSMNRIGKEVLELRLRDLIAEKIEHGENG